MCPKWEAFPLSIHIPETKTMKSVNKFEKLKLK
jgi:hypothetical protein